jgi:hypothetical protein
MIGKPDMLRELQTYYDKHGILATSFHCRFKDQCQNGCDKFTGPKSAYVGTGYEANTLPRLLFLSLDSGSGELDDIERLPTAVRRQEEIECNVSALPKNRHWYRTHELAYHILRKFKPDLELPEAKRYFAHANSAKCCMNNPGKKKAAATLFKNCERYLKGEITILLPRVIVTQGQEARAAVSNLADRVANRLDDFASIIEFETKAIFWLHTYHPNNYDKFNKHRRPNKASTVLEGWERHASQIEEFIKNSG